MRRFLAACLAAFMFLGGAGAAELRVQNRVLTYSVPAGFCELKHSAETFQFYDRALGKSVAAAGMLAPCAEADRPGRILLLGGVGVDDKMLKFRLGRPLYLEFISLLRVSSLEKTLSRANARLKDYDAVIEDLTLSDPIKEADRVSYYGSAALVYQGRPLGLSFKAATTLIRRVPVAAAMIYDNAGDPEGLGEAYEAVLRDLLANER